ncbi:hypothetical protein NFI96_010964 [Prochilodus magdalenae]|nr:hypothetical protein NFI96_010964 [Prochilodus magdalenae]
MAEGLSVLELDFTCPICCEVFKDPVALKCSHSFCKECLQQCWKTQEVPLCPICRKECAQDEPTRSLAFSSLCENFKSRKLAVATDDRCPEHDEKLKLFCFEDKQPICVVCYTSKKHRNHKCSPIVEAVQELKEAFKVKMETLNAALDSMSKVRDGYKEQAEQITDETQSAEEQIKTEFEKLHRFLREEEEARIAALRKRETMKKEIIQARINELSTDISALSESIAFAWQEMEADDIPFLKRSSENLMRLERPSMPTVDLETKMDETNLIQTLLFTVWARMQNLISSAPVTLDPNTASKKLVLSEDLSSVSFVKQEQDVDNNPERLHVGVLGSQGFTSALHCWDVKVGDNDHWMVGVVKQSVERKRLLKMDPGSGMWSIRFVDKRYWAGLKPRRELWVLDRPWVIRVQLDYDKGEIHFYDPFRNATLYTFRNITFTEAVFPYVCTGDPEHDLNLYPANKLSRHGQRDSKPFFLQDSGQYCKMATANVLISDETVTCPICCEVFKDPVALKCSHSFCKECLQQCWKTQEVPLCPICRKECAQDEPTRSLAFSSLCENFKSRANQATPADRCPEHDEKLKLFCFEDKQPICVVCYTSKKHRNHQCAPIVEAAQDLKAEVRSEVSGMMQNLQVLNKSMKDYQLLTETIQEESQTVEKVLRKEFDNLCQFLREEEEARVTVLREEELKISEKTGKRIEKLSYEISSLSGTLKMINQGMEMDDITFIQSYANGHFSPAKNILPSPTMISGINTVKHLGFLDLNLRARMYELLHEPPKSVILDVDTASNKLVVSENLRSLSFMEQKQDVPDNPERLFAGVMGCHGFSSGLHCWDVEVGDNDSWTLGVVKQSVARKMLLKIDPSSGIWCFRLVNGKYRIGVKSRKELKLSEKPRVIRVQLDYDKGSITFSDPSKGPALHTFTDTFQEALFPYFNTTSTICPLHIL